MEADGTNHEKKDAQIELQRAKTGFIPKVNVDQGNTLQIISGGGKLFLVEEHIR